MQLAVVRYGRLLHIAEFVPRGDQAPQARRSAVVSTPRGLELGRVLAVVERDAEREPLPAAPGSLVRMAEREDRLRARELRRRADEEDLPRVRDHVAGQEGLALIALERLFDGERAVAYYTATRRVEVPQLARELTRLLELPVTLQQLGARQRARATGGCGACGRALCCVTFLRRLEPVPMRMARVQGLELGPSATAGACGRLKCCLRYENPLYEQHRRGMPGLGHQVRSRRASGRVVAVDVLRRRVLVKPEGAPARVVYAAEIEHQAPPPRARLPVAGEPPPPPTSAVDEAPKGWSGIARRLWRRMRKEREES